MKLVSVEDTPEACYLPRAWFFVSRIRAMNPVWDEQSHVMGIRIPLPMYGRVRNYVSNRWSESHWLRFFFRMRFTDLVTPDGRHIHDIKCMGCFE